MATETAAGFERATDPVPRRLLPDSAEVLADESLAIGGCPVAELAAEFGTPVFVYDEDHLRARCREAVAAFGDGVSYATKAFLCLAMARLVHEEGMHLDVATGGELHVALAAGVPADRLVVHGNNKNEAELRRAREVGVGRTVVDSFDELDRLDRLHAADGRVPRVLVRATPGVEAHTHEFVRTGQVDSKFGFGVASGDLAKASWSASTPTSAARCSSPTSSTRRSTSSRRGCATSTCRSCRSAAGSECRMWWERKPPRSPNGGAR